MPRAAPSTESSNPRQSCSGTSTRISGGDRQWWPSPHLRALSRRCELSRPQDRIRDVRPDLLPHLSADHGRETIMETGKDAGGGNLFGIGGQIAEAMGDTRNEWACHRHLWNVLGAKHGLNH